MIVEGGDLPFATQRLLAGLSPKDVVFTCIGTDRSTGDSLGPLVGTYLSEYGFNVVGTVDDPLHAGNMRERIKHLPKKKKVVAIDACLGKEESVEKFVVQDGPLRPGAGVGKNLPPVGNFHIAGIVNIGGFMEFHVLQNTRLSRVMKMAEQIVSAITCAFDAAEVAASEAEEETN